MRIKVIICAGSVSGNIYPALALADEVKTRHPENQVLLIGGKNFLEDKIFGTSPYRELYPHKLLEMKWCNHCILWLVELFILIFKAGKIFKEFKPDFVIGTGGQISLPIVFAAILYRIKTAVLEVNARPSRINRWLGFFTSKVFFTFERCAKFFKTNKSANLGNPVRTEILTNYLKKHQKHDKFTLLVLSSNKLPRLFNDQILAAFSHLSQDLADKLKVIHQSPCQSQMNIAGIYEQIGIEAETVDYIEDMADTYCRADLVVSRAGATTVTELMICKRSAILIPSPLPDDYHETENARALTNYRAAYMIESEGAEETGIKIAFSVRELVENPKKLKEMESRCGILGRPEAAKEIIDCMVEMR